MSVGGARKKDILLNFYRRLINTEERELALTTKDEIEVVWK